MSRDATQETRDRGASLMELIIATVVMSLISVGLLGVVAAFVRNDADAAERMDESRDLQQISAYLPGDLSSAFQPELLIDTDGDGTEDAIETGTPTSCPGYSGTNNNVISLAWSESFGGSTTQYRVEYRTQVSGADTQIVRVSCSGTSLGNATTRIVARQLRATNPVTTDVVSGLVTLSLHEKTGRTLKITVSSQNPHAELEQSSDYDS